MRRVCITGLGVVSPIGCSKEEVLTSLLEKKCGIDLITQFDTTEFKTKLAAEVKNFETKYFTQRDFKFNDRFVKFAREAAKMAVTDSNLDVDSIDNSRFGAIISSGIGGIGTIEKFADVMKERGPSRISPYFIPMILINLAVGNISIDNKIKGHTSSIVTACAASANAIGEAFLKIRDGYQDIMLAGGAEASITPLSVGGFEAMRALSFETDKTKASIPFDQGRNGFVMGEGSAILVLEEYEHAKKRNAHIYAEIVGYGESSDAYHITSPDVSGESVALAMEKAIKMANIKKEEISYINAHGTSTKLNDETEAKAINKLFEHKPYVSSTKSYTGHLLGAAGAIEALISAISLENSLIPPSINVLNPEDNGLNLVLNECIKTNVNYIMSNSLGFGGHNVSLIFKKYEE